MLVIKDRRTHDRQLLQAKPLVAAFAKAMSICMMSLTMYLIEKSILQRSLTPVDAKHIRMEVSVAFAARSPPTLA
jgi:hypothetical protein